MSDEEVFLHEILAKPDDATVRFAYADWLEERGDSRARFLRLASGIERINYVDWLKSQGGLEYYLQHFPELKRLAEERKSTEPLQQELQALSGTIDASWLAFINTLGCPFLPFYFFNNQGNPREFGPDELPFKEQIGTRGAIITFESAFRNSSSWDQGLIHDLQFLCQLRLGTCYYGAATCPVHPFACELMTSHGHLTGGDVISALRAQNFRSDHIQTLRATSIPFPGYHPGTYNDEIHDDPTAQHIFRRPSVEVDEGDDAGGSNDAYAALQEYVDEGHLWYVLVHATPYEVSEGTRLARYVVLFAVGRSPHGNRLIGVVTHQVCHNLCD